MKKKYQTVMIAVFPFELSNSLDQKEIEIKSRFMINAG